MITRRAIGWVVFMTAFAGSVARGDVGNDTPQPTLRVSLFSGATEYQSDASLEQLKDFFEKNYNTHCTLNKVTDIHTLPGIEQLDTCDVVVVFTRRLELSPEQIDKIQRYVRSGKPVVGIRTASHAFQTWLAFDHEVLGGDYHNHAPKDEMARLSIPKSSADHPVLAGVKLFPTMGKLYKNPQIAADVTVLLTATTAEENEPVAWVRTRPQDHDQRVFYTSLGVPEDFQKEGFRRLLANAIYWTARRTPEPAINR